MQTVRLDVITIKWHFLPSFKIKSPFIPARAPPAAFSGNLKYQIKHKEQKVRSSTNCCFSTVFIRLRVGELARVIHRSDARAHRPCSFAQLDSCSRCVFRIFLSFSEISWRCSKRAHVRAGPAVRKHHIRDRRVARILELSPRPRQ